MTPLPSFLYKIDFLVCHQIQTKTFSLCSQYMPLCARCTGIYSGFFIGMAYQLVAGKKLSGFPPKSILFTSLGLILLMVVQVITEGSFPSLNNNHLRFLTGILCGGSVSVLFFPIFIYFIYEKTPDKPVINSQRSFFLLPLILTGFFSLHFIQSPVVFYVLGYVSTAGAVTAYIATNLLLASIVINLRGKKRSFNSSVLICIIAICFLLVEIILLKFNPLRIQ